MERENRYNINNNNNASSSWTSSSSSNRNGSGGMTTTSSSSSMKPAWLEGLMVEAFFGGCGVHGNRRKNEKNVFCLLCCLSICPHCLPSHRSHPLLQVRRYVYHDVIRLGDLEKLIDCTNIQPYTINSAKVIFLKQRPQSRSGKGSASASASASTNNCFTCDRILQDPFHFCSLSCKVDHLVEQGDDLTTFIYKFDASDFAFSQFEGLRMDSSENNTDDQITPTTSILDERLREECKDNSGVETKKEKSGFLAGNFFSLASMSRRKGSPHRAPLS